MTSTLGFSSQLGNDSQPEEFALAPSNTEDASIGSQDSALFQQLDRMAFADENGAQAPDKERFENKTVLEEIHLGGDSPVKPAKKSSKFRPMEAVFVLDWENDNGVPDALVPVGHRFNDPSYADTPKMGDDDGYTAALRYHLGLFGFDEGKYDLEIFGSFFEMLTERMGGRDSSPGQNFRQDISRGAVIVRRHFDKGLSVTAGGGYETIGNQGFAKVQAGFHAATENTMGGRSLEQLQSEYAGGNRLRTVPVIHLGARWKRERRYGVLSGDVSATSAPGINHHQIDGVFEARARTSEAKGWGFEIFARGGAHYVQLPTSASFLPSGAYGSLGAGMAIRGGGFRVEPSMTVPVAGDTMAGEPLLNIKLIQQLGHRKHFKK